MACSRRKACKPVTPPNPPVRTLQEQAVDIEVPRALPEGHYHLLWVAAQLAAEKGQTAESTKYQGWADDLRQAIETELFIDDMGWKDISCAGSMYFETPNIDKIANQGIIYNIILV